MPPKRKAAVKKEEEESMKQQKQDGQKAVSHDIDVPLDEGFQEDGKHIWPSIGVQRLILESMED